MRREFLSAETLARVLWAMRPAESRIAAESTLAHSRIQYRDRCDESATEELLDAAGGFYSRLSQYALDAHMDDVYRQLTAAWTDVALAYGAGENLDEKTFRLYSIAVTFRIVAI